MSRLPNAVLIVCLSVTGVFAETPAIPTQPPTLCSVKPSDDSKLLCKDLATFDEPAAPLTRSITLSFRLLYLRSFDPAVLVRIDTSAAGDVTLTAKEITIPQLEEDQGDRRLGLNESARLSHAENSRFQAVIQRTNFWNSPAQYHLDWNLGTFGSGPPPKNAVVMSDGAIWVVEGISSNRYHVMLDDGGAFESPVREIGLAMLRLAKKRIPTLDIEPIY